MADTLYDLASILRSKNSGPFEITLDILFDSQKNYERVKGSGILSEEIIAKLYAINPKTVKGIFFFDAALGIKITFLRKISSGTAGDLDVYGAQQHAPLMTLSVPV